MNTTKLSDSLNLVLSHIPSLSTFNAVVACTAVWAFVKLIRMSRKRLHTTGLRGPPNPSFVYGVGRLVAHSDDPASLYESWAREYGSVYAVPSTLGTSRIILYDPKALAHYYAKESWSYGRMVMTKRTLQSAVGRGLFSADGESHRRQRKSLTPAFSIAAIRKLTPIFYDSAHKVKGRWNNIIELSGGEGAIIDVQSWMNYVSLDTIGIACFSHDFGAVDGKRNSIIAILDTFAQAFPILVDVPTTRTRLLWKMKSVMKEISLNLLARTKRELEKGVVAEGDKSVIGLLIKGESAQSESQLTNEEVLAQMNTLLVAGYETTAISLTWALIELSKNPGIQTRLRNELLDYDSDPTYDQLMNELPYLDAVVHEIFRIHTPAHETIRMAFEDNVLPLSEPVRSASGELVDTVTIAKGTLVTVPMASINLATSIWGEDAKVFRPGRWVDGDGNTNGIPAKAKEFQGHRHLLTFSDGPRICIGKNFAVTEFKAVLSVLVKHFVFELRDGEETKIEMARGILPRPRVAGEVGCKVPLRVKPYTG